MQKDELKATGVRSFYLRYFCGLVIFFLAITASVSQAQSSTSAKDYLKASNRNYDKAISAAPRFALAYAGRGLARLLEGEQEKAERDVRRCFKLDPTLKSSLDSRIAEITRPHNATNL